MIGSYGTVIERGGSYSIWGKVKQYVARLNGTDQYWQLSEDINLEDSDIVNFKFIGGEVFGTYRRFIGSDNFSFGLTSGATGDYFNEVILVAAMDGEPIETEITQIPLSGSHDISCVIVGDHTLSQLCAANSSRFMRLPMYEFEVIRNGAVIHEIPLTNKAQGAYQVATTTPLGENLYTQEVIENPDTVGEQWSYLGNGKWYLNGDGSLSALQFLFSSSQPTSGYVEFEIESISGGSLTCTSGTLSESTFTTIGKKTYYYGDLQTQGGIIQFKRRQGSIQAVIKNIKHYDADGVLIATMVGYTPDVWEQA